MNNREPKFTGIRVDRSTQRKIALLAAVLDRKIYEMVATWTEREWKAAKQAGMVKEAMIEPEKQGE